MDPLPQEARHNEHDGQPLHDIVGFKPGYYEGKITPDLPTHNKGY